MKLFAMIFPGQGSQKIGMLAEMAIKNKIIKNTFAEASSILGYNLWQLVQYGPAKKLNQTEYTQPALLTASIAIWRVWLHCNGSLPAFMAGHSLGEYSALVCAGSISFDDAIYLVAKRGKLMQEAIPIEKSAVVAIIGLDAQTVINACVNASQGEIVSPTNYNLPDQTVIAGHKEAVARAADNCKIAGAKLILPLPISVPSHCSLMKEVAIQLAIQMEKIKIIEPKIPVINNVDVSVEYNPNAIRQALIRQIYSPVQWTKIIEYCVKQGVKILLEIGPSKVLTGLIKRINNLSLLGIAVNNTAALNIANKMIK